jgi:hypothetical protein
MYTLDEVSEALRRFANWSADEELRKATADLLDAGEIEVAGIVDGEFVLRKCGDGS